MLKPWLSPPPPAYDSYRPWLTFPGSLTQRIVSRSRQFRVERRFQGARLPSRDETKMLGLRDKQLVHVREVILCADGTPVVFAHSVVAMRDMDGAWRGVGKLGSRPLAAALFANPRVTRFPLEYRQVNRLHHLHARVRSAGLSPPPVLWARRSLFRLRGRPLLVTEVFLPSILGLTQIA